MVSLGLNFKARHCLLRHLNEKNKERDKHREREKKKYKEIEWKKRKASHPNGVECQLVYEKGMQQLKLIAIQRTELLRIIVSNVACETSYWIKFMDN